jgi:HK97 family phage portal protein
MGVVDRINAEVRAIGGVPWQPWRNPYWRFDIGGPVHPFREVGGVDEIVGLAAVYSCVRFIADALASLPINVYRRKGDGTSQLMPDSQLLHNPSADLNTTVYDWLFMCMTSALLWGNAWGLISSRTGVSSPNGLGYPQTIEWLPPDHVQVQDDEQQPWNPLRAKVYLQGREIPREQLVQVRAFVIPGRLEAISPLRAFAMLFGQGTAALRYSADWFRSGGFPPGTFQNLAEEVDAEAAREIRQRLTDTLRTRQPLVYGKDWDYRPVVVPPNEAAFVEAMQLNATQVAAIYGVPPTKVGGRRGDSLTYATQEQETLSIITDTLRPWLVRMEHLLTALLPSTQYARFNTDALLKTDLKTRSDIYRTQREIGMVTIDEIRQKEDLPPLPGDLGGETIPLDTLSRMSGTTRAIPKSMLPQLKLEAEIVAELLEKFEKEGWTQPEGPAGGTELPEPGTAGVVPKDGSPPPANGSAPAGGAPGAPDQPNGMARPGQGVVKGPLVYLGGQMTLGRASEEAAHLRAVLDHKYQPPPETAVYPRGDEVKGFFGMRFHLATDKDRTGAQRWLIRAAEAGCMDVHELEDRLHKVSGARFKGALDELVKDLPPENELPEPQEAGGTEDEAGLPPLFGPQALALLQGRDPALNGTK